MVAGALGAGEHGVVVGDHQATGAIRVEEIAVHRRESRHDAVARRVADQVLARTARRLRRNGERAVFDEAAGVHESRDVLARRAMVRLAAFGDGLRPVRVETERLARQHVGEVRADRVGIGRLGLRRRPAVDVGRLEKEDRVVLVERVAFPSARLAHDAAGRRRDEMLHLHRLQDRDLLARAHRVSVRNVDRHDRALERRGHGDRPLRIFERARAGVSSVRLGPLVIEGAMLPARRLQEIAEPPLDEARVDAIGDEVGVCQHRLQKGNVRLDAGNGEFAERPRQPARGGGEIRRLRMDNDLGYQRIERGDRAIARIAEGVDAHAGAGRKVERGDAPAARQDPAGRRHGFEIDPRLDRIATGRARRVEPEFGETRAGGDANLGRCQFDAKNFLGDGVLHLQPGIRLDEGEPRVVASVRRIDQELERAEAVVGGRARDPHRRRHDALAQVGVERGARRDLDQLLAATLDRALPLAEMGDPAAPVAQNLDLNVPGAFDQALRVQRSVAERVRRLRLATSEGFGDLGFTADGAHAAAPAAGHGLEQDRRAHAHEKRPRRLDAADRSALDDRRACPRGGVPRAELVAEHIERFGRRSDERYPGRSDGAGEAGILGEKAVAGMDRVAAGCLSERDDARAVEIGRDPCPAERMGFVRLAQMERGGVVLGIDRDAGDLKIGRGASDAHGDLAAIGDQQFAEGGVGHEGENLGRSPMIVTALRTDVESVPYEPMC